MDIYSALGMGVWNRDQYGVTRTYTVTGHSFNPPLGSYFDGYNLQDAWISNEGYLWDLAGYYPGTEVLLGFSKVVGPSNAGVGHSYWIDTFGSISFDYTYSFPALAAGYWSYTWSYIGIRPASKGNTAEISTNGTYTYTFLLNGVYSTKNYTVSNLSTSLLALHTGSEGYVWVEGDNICFISYMGTKHIISNDGSTYGYVGTSASGSMWVPNITNTNYLCYIDSSGYLRRTHNGDRIGWQGYDGVGTGGHAQGYIWAEWGFNWACLMFINYDGWQIRISNGYMWGNAY